MTTMPRVLTIAGSDSGGGAGLQADLKTFAALECHGCSAVTAVTAQNSFGVKAIYALSVEAVELQIRSVLEDIGADSIKTGMLYSSDIVDAVARVLAEFKPSRLVVDPVLIAKGGAALLEKRALGVLVKKLFPLAALVAPNIPEAEIMLGMSIKSDRDRLTACRALLDMGSRSVLLKGGHAEGARVKDFFMDADGNEQVLDLPRLNVIHTHGTGCTVSAAIAAYLAKGQSMRDATVSARSFIQTAIAEGYPLGKGVGPVNPIPLSFRGHNVVLERLRSAWDILEDSNPVHLIPEVQSNLAEALPNASTFKDVAAFPGRIVKCGSKIRRLDGPRFGGSQHMAKILLASSRMGSRFKAVMNIRYGEDVLEACSRKGFSIESFNRLDEPKDVKFREGSSLEWGTLSVLGKCKIAPDVVYDKGDAGKEPMIRVFGRDSVETAERVAGISNMMRTQKKTT